MPLTLTPRLASDRAPLAVDLDGLLPESLRPLDLGAIARLEVEADGVSCAVGDLFDLAGDPADERIVCRGDFANVHRIGSGMTRGWIDVVGSAGRHAGEGMAGGVLTISEHAGDWLAAAMRGGEVRVGGNAGDNTAAALPGSDHGVCGGLVVVAGNVGNLAAARMRRGMLAVGGSCGPGAGFELRAGTVFVAGSLGPHAGLGMRRGSLVTLTTPPVTPSGFLRGAAWSPAFVPLLARRLERSGFCLRLPAAGTPWRQWHGDRLTGGRGELFHPESTAVATA